MSILIKCAKMPSSCAVCPCYKWESDYGCAVKHEEPKDFKKRPSWCPLVEIPPHGDLIDRDKLMKSLEHEWDICMDDTEFANKIVPNGIKDAPTVIESEEEE